MKGMKISAVSIVRYSGAFLKSTSEKLRQTDERRRKLMTIHKTLLPRGNIHRHVCQEKKEEKDTPALRTASTQQFEENTKITDVD